MSLISIPEVQLGAVLPQPEITDATLPTVVSFVRSVEALGYRHLLAYDHVLGADRSQHPDYSGIYDDGTPFLETMVLFGALAASTSLDLFTGIMVLPQRQTALVAKQAATLDALTPNRLRLGVGVGWNRIEYDGLGMDFSTRGRRLDEQIALLRELWAHKSVRFKGRFDTIEGAGVLPRPPAGTIPVWIGAGRRSTNEGPPPAAVERIARLSDGFMSTFGPGNTLKDLMTQVRRRAEEHGRDPRSIGLQGGISASLPAAEIRRRFELWVSLGATHVTLNPLNSDLPWPHGHLEALESATEALKS